MILPKIILTTRVQLIILLLLAFALNFNTLFNEYAMDDAVVFTNNTLVKKGIKAIPEIFTSDLYYGFGKKNIDLAGGRYRPIELAVFAIEYQVFGQNPFVSHLISVLLFVLLIALLYKLLHDHIFKEFAKRTNPFAGRQPPYLAFITCLIYAGHPIHTEVIANVKSRDELISFILTIATSFLLIKYSIKRSWYLMLSALSCFFLALLARESAVPFIVVAPLVAYFFFNQPLKKSILISIPLMAVFLIYMVIRISVLGFGDAEGKEIMNYPFLYATFSQGIATKIFILVKYLWLMVYPYPLSCDYGYNEISYVGLSSIQFLLSFILLLGLLIYAIITFKSKSLISFCILYFVITIFLFSNFVINIGSFLAERLLFQPSLAFCIVIATLYIYMNNHARLISNVFLFLILGLFSLKTIQRNFEWKNDKTLYFADMNSTPNSVRINFNAATNYVAMATSEPDKKLKEEYFKKAIELDEKVLKAYRNYFPVYSDLGFAYYNLQDYFKAADCWKQASLMDSSSSAKKRVDLVSEVLYNEGNKKYRVGDIEGAIKWYKKSLELNDKNVDGWYNLGKSYFKINDTKNGVFAWENVKRLSPDYKLITEALPH